MWRYLDIAVVTILGCAPVLSCSGKGRQSPPTPAGADAGPLPDAVLAAAPGRVDAMPGDGRMAPDRAGDAPIDVGPTTRSGEDGPFAASTRSLQLRRSIAVRMAPDKDAERYGTIAAGTWVGWKRALDARPHSGCEGRWVEIEPFGWICEQLLQPSELPPKGVELPRLEREELVPGVYAKVVGEQPVTFYKEGKGDEIEMVRARALEGSVMVRRYGELVVDQAVDDAASPVSPAVENDASAQATGDGPDAGVGTKGDDGGESVAKTGPVTYWQITQGRKAEYLSVKSLREYRPSKYHGLRLGDDTGRAMPIGYPRSEQRLVAKIPVYSAARGGRRVDRVPTRTPIPVLDSARAANGRVIAYRIGDERWVRASQMLLVDKTAPPPGTDPHERWMDLDLDTQVLVAYEGELPVYTTMVATGSKKHPTGTGIFRIWVKFAEKNMSDLAGEDPYSVATVPWVQFYDKGLALHTSYWHDKFGTRRSHGCTNLAPADARFLYFWSEPTVPPGWSMAKGTIEHPGSMVRIRSRDDPEPQFQGYALDVFQARQASSRPSP